MLRAGEGLGAVALLKSVQNRKFSVSLSVMLAAERKCRLRNLVPPLLPQRPSILRSSLGRELEYYCLLTVHRDTY